VKKTNWSRQVIKMMTMMTMSENRAFLWSLGLYPDAMSYITWPAYNTCYDM